MNDIKREIATALLINPLPASTRVRLLLDDTFRATLGIQPQFWFPLKNGVAVETTSLHNALRAAIAGRKTASLTLKGGKRRRVRLRRQNGGKASFVLGKEGFSFTNSDLLAANPRARLNALTRVMSAQPLLAAEEAKWLAVAKARAFTDREYDDLMTTLGHTPEGFSAELEKPQGLDPESMMPDSPDYYDRLVGRLERSTDLTSFIADELASARASLLERHPRRAIRRIAFSALWQPLVPFDLTAGISPEDLSPLLEAEDPFSLLFGFEICRAHVEADDAFSDLGAAFLQKLFGDKVAGQRRCELFTACALVSVISVRQAARASSAPVFWARLAALAHAGVLSDALARMPDTKGFLDWAARNFLSNYIWHSTVDRREAPRWKPEWISPDHIFAELVGRAQGALYMLPENRRPASWVSIIEAAIQQLIDDGDMPKAIFPGPFDDFQGGGAVAPALGDALAEVEAELGRAERLGDVPGMVALAYATVPSGTAVENVSRILSLPAEEPSDSIDDDLSWLQIAAHCALAAHSESVAQAVIDRCFALLGNASASELITDLFATIVKACAVHGVGRKYREALGENAARICFITHSADDLAKLEAILTALVLRDEKLSHCLARASAIIRTKRGRI